MVTLPAARRSLASCVLVALLSACESNDAMAPDPSLAAGNGPKGNNPIVRITPSSDTADALGATIQLTVNASAPTWTSLTPGIVTVDDLGRVLSVGTGMGLVQAMVGRKADTAEVLVRQIPASLTVTPDTLHFIFGNDPQMLTAVVADANGFPVSPQPAVTWSSDDPSVATVDDNGVITATLNEGFTWIRAVFQAFTDSALVDMPANPYP